MGFLTFLFGPPNVEKLKTKNDVNRLIKALGYKKDADISNAAMDALVVIGAPVVESLIAALKHKDKSVPPSAAKVLGKIGDARAVEPLIAVLGDGISTVGTIHHAAIALGKLGDKRAVEPLIAVFIARLKQKVERDPEFKTGEKGNNFMGWGRIFWKSDIEDCKAVAEALGEIGDARAVEPLIAALKDEDICESATEALRNIRDQSQDPKIRELIEQELTVR